MTKSYDNTDKPDGKKGEYYNAEILYLYPPKGKRTNEIKDKLYFEQCLSNCNGIRPKGGDNKKDSIQCVYDRSLPDTVKFLAVMESFYSRLVDLIIPFKVDLKSKEFTKVTAKALMKELIYMPTDKITGESDPHKNPSQFYNLNSYANNKTTFYKLDKKEFEWKELQKAQFRCIPLIRYDKLYAGGNGKISVQSDVQSVVVHTDIKAVGSINRQAGTIDKIKIESPEAIEEQKKNLDMFHQYMAAMLRGNVESKKETDEKPLTETGVTLGGQQETSKEPDTSVLPSSTPPSSSSPPAPSGPSVPSQQTNSSPIPPPVIPVAFHGIRLPEGFVVKK